MVEGEVPRSPLGAVTETPKENSAMITRISKTYDSNEEIRLETIRRQLGIMHRIDYGCVTVMSSEDELVDDYNLNEYCD